MRHILLTWNPGPDNHEQWSPEEWSVDMVDGTAEGHTRNGRWSVGNRVQGIEPGDRAYLFRQGVNGRGVVAVGDITSEPFADESWREVGGTAQYVYVTWLEAVPIEERIDIRELKASIPEFNWDSVYSSGREVTQHGSALEEMWSGQATESAPLPSVVQGAGFGTAEQNRRVEQAAIDYVIAVYEAEGYEVSSVEAEHRGWDLTVEGSDEEFHVEVKGVASSLVRFFLTANEYKTALRDPRWVLVVVTDALGVPGWAELSGPAAASYAHPVLYQARVPDEAFTV